MYKAIETAERVIEMMRFLTPEARKDVLYLVRGAYCVCGYETCKGSCQRDE